VPKAAFSERAAMEDFIMKKDTRIMIGICIILLVAAGFLFVRQQKHTSGFADEFISAEGQEMALETGSGSDTVQDSSKQENKETAVECAVYISGAVKHPGLYRYYGTARVSDAIEAVGGFRKNADKEAVNLARILADGEQICVLTKKETARRKKNSEKNSSAPDTKEQNTTLININKASMEELMSLPGIGQAKAALIIDYRAGQGGFSRKEDLMKISGIKEGVYNKIKNLISV